MLILLLFISLFCFIFIFFFSFKMSRNIILNFSIFTTILLLLLSIYNYFLINNLQIIYNYNIWINTNTFYLNFSFILDTYNATMLLMIVLIFFFVILYSINYLYFEPFLLKFLSFLFLFVFFMFFLVSSNNLLQLFIGWEGVGLCSFSLISLWGNRLLAIRASLKALIINRVGDLFLLSSCSVIFFYFGTLNFSNLKVLIFNLQEPIYINFGFLQINTITFICICLLIGCIGKSAQIGLHTWLPDAMEGPTPVSALIHAATMVTAGIFLLIKTSFFFEYSNIVLLYIIFFGIITAFMASTISLLQNDIKKIIAYSTCSQLGLMFLFCGLSGYYLSLFHLFNHAIFKALLFLIAGIIIFNTNDEQDIRKISNFFFFFPLVYIVLLIASFALIGFPFLSGFYSKDLIIQGIFNFKYTFNSFFILLICLITMLSSLYSTRLLIKSFFSFQNINYNLLFFSPLSFFFFFILILLCLCSIVFGYIFLDMFSIIGNYSFQNNFLFFYKNNENMDFEFFANLIKFLPIICTLGGLCSCFLFLEKSMIFFILYKYLIKLINFLRYQYNHNSYSLLIRNKLYSNIIILLNIYYKIINFITSITELFFINFFKKILNFFFFYIKFFLFQYLQLVKNCKNSLITLIISFMKQKKTIHGLEIPIIISDFFFKFFNINKVYENFNIIQLFLLYFSLLIFFFVYSFYILSGLFFTIILNVFISDSQLLINYIVFGIQEKKSSLYFLDVLKYLKTLLNYKKFNNNFFCLLLLCFFSLLLILNLFMYIYIYIYFFFLKILQINYYNFFLNKLKYLFQIYKDFFLFFFCCLKKLFIKILFLYEKTLLFFLFYCIFFQDYNFAFFILSSHYYFLLFFFKLIYFFFSNYLLKIIFWFFQQFYLILILIINFLFLLICVFLKIFSKFLLFILYKLVIFYSTILTSLNFDFFINHIYIVIFSSKQQIYVFSFFKLNLISFFNIFYLFVHQLIDFILFSKLIFCFVKVLIFYSLFYLFNFHYFCILFLTNIDLIINNLSTIPVEFQFKVVFLSFLVISSIYYIYIQLKKKINKQYYYFYKFFSQKWFFDIIQNYIFSFFFFVKSFRIFELLDKGYLEKFGPWGLQFIINNLSLKILKYHNLNFSFYFQIIILIFCLFFYLL